jgi:hypothetical protein
MRTCDSWSWDQNVFIQNLGDLKFGDGEIMKFQPVGIDQKYEIFLFHLVVHFVKPLHEELYTMSTF